MRYSWCSRRLASSLTSRSVHSSRFCRSSSSGTIFSIAARTRSAMADGGGGTRAALVEDGRRRRGGPVIGLYNEIR